MSNATEPRQSDESRRQLIESLPPALRAAVEACPFDLVPWIDFTQPLPTRPILLDLEAFARENSRRGLRSTRKPRPSLQATLPSTLADPGFFDASDLSAPRLQYVVWQLLRLRKLARSSVHSMLLDLRRFMEWLQKSGKIRENPLAEGVNLHAWARGELPDINRLPARAWYWLNQNEDFASPTGGKLALLVDLWNDLSDGTRKEIDPQHWEKLPVATERDRFLSVQRVNGCVMRARSIRENAPGVDLCYRPRLATAGSCGARDELFAMWRLTRSPGQITRRRRWQAFPRKVRISIAGRDARCIRDLAPRAAALFRPPRSMCDVTRCPRARKFKTLLEGKTANEVLAWYKRLGTREKKAICPVHVRTPLGPDLVRSEARRVRPYSDPFRGAKRATAADKATTVEPTAQDAAHGAAPVPEGSRGDRPPGKTGGRPRNEKLRQVIQSLLDEDAKVNYLTVRPRYKEANPGTKLPSPGQVRAMLSHMRRGRTKPRFPAPTPVS